MADDQDDPHAEDEGPWPRLEPITSARLGIDVYSDPRVPRGQVWAMPAGGWPPIEAAPTPGDRVAFRTEDGRVWVGTVDEVTPTDVGYDLRCSAGGGSVPICPACAMGYSCPEHDPPES